jgi:hypothetical protein
MYKNGLDYILENQKVGGYWVWIKWEKGCEWNIWVNSDEELENIINKEIAKGGKIKEITKNV